MSQKRGQVSVFIIIGIVVLAIVGVIIYISGMGAEDVKKEAEEVPYDITPLKSFANSCIKETMNKAFYLLGYGGGNIYIPENNLRVRTYNTSYGYYLGEPNVPSLYGISSEIEYYMRNNIDNCTNNFSSFPDYKVTGDIENVRLDFTDEKVLYSVDYPLTIRKGSSTSKVSDFGGELNIRMRKIHGMMDSMVNTSVSIAPYLVDIDAIRESGMNVTAISFPDNNILYVIRDSMSRLYDEDYTFVFASKVGPEYNISTDGVRLRIREGTAYADFSQGQ